MLVYVSQLLTQNEKVMKKHLIIIWTFLLVCFSIPIKAQSLFDDYGKAVTNLGATPYASLNLDAMDFNPSGNVFLRKGLELSLSSLWPRWATIENQNSFSFKNIEVSRKCVDYCKGGVPNPSIRISYRQGDNAFSFSYAHGESVMNGNGNTCFDEIVQKVVPESANTALGFMSSIFSLANLLNQQYGLDIQAPYSNTATFPIAFLSNSTQYGCRSDKLSIGYSCRISIGGEDNWEYVSLFGGLKYQNMTLYQNTYISPYCYDEHGNFISMHDICEVYSKFYYRIANEIPDMHDSFESMAQSFNEFGQAFDTLYKRPRSREVKAGGFNVVLGFNLVHPYWNLASTLECGSLPFKFSLGYSRYIGKWQFSIGGDLGCADVNYGAYSRLFYQQLDYNVNNCCYGDFGVEVARCFPTTYLTLKVGNSLGFNKDILLCNGYSLLVEKHNTYSPSFIVEWQASSLFTLMGGIKAQFPIGKKEFNIGFGGIVESNATCIIKPEYCMLIGFVTHLE